MASIQEKFFALLRYSIGNSKAAPLLSFNELKAIYAMAEKQSLVAIMLEGVKNLPRPLKMREGAEGLYVEESELDECEDLIMSWAGKGISTARRNARLDKDVAEVFDLLRKDGLEACLLKGQGNALMYPNPSARTAGDIDVWCRPVGSSHTKVDVDIRQVIDYVKSKCPTARAIYHHIDGLKYDGVEVEAHYRPHFMLNLKHNRRLQQYFAEHADEQFHHFVKIGGKGIAVPTFEFNVVFQLSHIYQHLFHEGIGLRQCLDYYYLLKAAPPQPSPNGAGEKLLRRLGLEKIAGALMWILVNEFGMDAMYAIIEPDEKQGKFVLNEILQGGNFGKYDERAFSGLYSSPIMANLQRLNRDWRLMRYFTSESLSEPVFRVCHWWWRRIHK